jgi:hypothetical protein
MLMLSRAPAARVYRSRERKNENLRRSYRSARAAQSVTGKKVQRYGSRQMKFCHLANVRSSPTADKLLQCRKCPLCAISRHSRNELRK